MKAGSRRSRLLRAAAAAVFAGGLAVTGWTGFQFASERSAQQRAVAEWRAQLPATGATASPAALPATSPSASALPLPPVPSGRWFLLRVPAAGYEEVVREGVTSPDLDIGPGHVPGTAWPGWPGNIGIGVHNTYWLAVGRLRIGARVVLETEYGVFTYRITNSGIVSPDTKGVFAQAGPQRVTLTTCWPLWAGAAATQRLLMVGEQVDAQWRITWPPR